MRFVKWVTIAGVFGLTAAAARLLLRRRPTTDTLGFVSQHWIAEHVSRTHEG